MDYPLQIPAGELCRLISTAPNELTVMEQAIRNLIESLYESDHLVALRERACLMSRAEEVVEVALVRRPRPTL